ncbi:MAG: NADPH-dependent FMN reductase [Bacteroidota bacterium]|nr:NADPH-dependent FMN reductase [Bacteroidota bacterium]MDP4229025.1 NADPH-dependent FMN reductase [Bacteroidota bacterium]
MALHILGICGSMRPNSSTAYVIKYALAAAAEAGAETDFYDIAEHQLPFCDGRQDESTYPSSVNEFKALIRSSQGIIIGTPEYHNSITGSLKNALDLCSTEEFEHKMVGIIGVAGGGMGAANAIGHLRTIMRGVGSWVVPHQVSISHSGKIFDGSGLLADVALEHRLKKLGTDVTKYARLFAAGVLDIDE